MKNAVCLITLCLLAQGAAAVPITVLTNSTAVWAYDAGLQTDSFGGVIVPSSDSLAATRGSASSTADVAMTGSDTSFAYDISMLHSIDATSTATEYARTVVSVLNFLAVEDATYSISGLYDILSANNLEVAVEAYLWDATTSTFLFIDTTRSRGVSAPTSFVVGDIGDGNDQNDTSGSLTGSLIAGHQYYFNINAGIINRTSAGYVVASGNASGAYTLDVASMSAPPPPPPTSVPEPGMLSLLGGSLLLLGFAHRRVRH